jgi:hypothetical protein
VFRKPRMRTSHRHIRRDQCLASLSICPIVQCHTGHGFHCFMVPPQPRLVRGRCILRLGLRTPAGGHATVAKKEHRTHMAGAGRLRPGGLGVTAGRAAMETVAAVGVRGTRPSSAAAAGRISCRVRIGSLAPLYFEGLHLRSKAYRFWPDNLSLHID